VANRYLTEKEALAAVGYAHRPYAIAAWRFLTKTGYINFGVAPSMTVKQNSRNEPPKGTVIVVGAGMAGKVMAVVFMHCFNMLRAHAQLAHMSLLLHVLACHQTQSLHICQGNAGPSKDLLQGTGQWHKSLNIGTIRMSAELLQ